MANNKNNNANGIQFNVTFGEYTTTANLPANAAVLLRNAKKRVGTEIVEFTEFMAVQGVRRITSDAIILPIMALMVADAKVRNNFANDYKIVTVGGEKIETKLAAKSLFTKWLSGNIVYKTDSEGILKQSLVLDEGLALKHTALSVKKTSPMLKATGEKLAALIKNAAKAVAKQASLKSDIFKTAENLYNATAGEKQTDAETKENATTDETAA